MKLLKSALLIIFLFLPASGFALQKGDIFPALPGTTLEGKLFNIGQLEAKPILLKIGTTWCPGCRKQAHEIEKIRPFMKEQGIEYVEVFLNESAKKVRKYLSKSTLKSPDLVLLDSKIIARALNVRMIPRLILIDKKFKVYRDGALLSSTLLKKELSKMLYDE